MVADTEEACSSYEETTNLVEKLSTYEQLGQDVITGKRILVELDERRQKCREAARNLCTKTASMVRTTSSSWVCLGDTTFLKVPTKQAINILEEDMKTIDETYELTRGFLKENVDKLRKMEGSKDLAELGFTLRSVI
uniref:P53 and DNA damage-regulated protein 1 n=1 Tax=Syphacia muris TaxID=451379 RepID=A0A0N5AAQ6_9BILA